MNCKWVTIVFAAHFWFIIPLLFHQTAATFLFFKYS
jgi:hypothetical protein